MRSIIFDADHTLYTPEADRAYDEKFSFLADKTGIDKEELERTWKEVVDEVEDGDRERQVYRKTLIGKMLERVGVENDEELVEEAYSLFWETVVQDLEYEEGLQEMLERLGQDFEILAIATDEFPEALEMKLSTVFEHPEEIFDDIVTPIDTGVMKPSPKFYEKILDSHDVNPSDAVMVGDSWDRDLAPAKELGMTTVLVLADTSDEPMEPESEGVPDPDYTIDSILELESVLEGGV